MTERPDVLNNHAILLAAKGNYDDAISCLKRAIILEKDNYLLWYNMGTTFRDAGKLKEARDAMETAYRLDPENMEVLVSLSQIALMQQDFERAAQVCHEGISFTDSNPEIWNLMGVIFFQQNVFKMAADCFERALTLNSFYADALFNLRDTYEELGEEVAVLECERRMRELGIE